MVYLLNTGLSRSKTLYLLHNALHYGSRGFPYERDGGKRPNLKYPRNLRCYAVVHPPCSRPRKLENHANVGWFLGYTATMTQAHYLDDVDWFLGYTFTKTQEHCLEECTLKVKTTSHAHFDEGM
jgi:hypothetical protein